MSGEEEEEVVLGYEVGTGEEVRIPVAHTIATGMTQAAGKTTAFEGLVARAGRPALAFRTKRGEGAFAGARVVPPFFKERTDWRFVESIVGAVLRQGMRFERAWIIKASRSCDTLADVRRRARNLMSSSKRSFDKDIYMLLGEYLDLVLPLLDKIPRAARPDIGGGLQVMDLGAFPIEVQMLVLHSTMTWVYEHAQGVLTVVPESWEFVPQKKDSPAKIATIALARKGAALRNFLYVDSQDLAGLDKEVVRQMRVYLLGVQRERNEIKRTLDHIPAGMRKPKGEQLAMLGRGQFYACWDDRIVKVYAQPAWASPDEAWQAAVAGGCVVRTNAGRAIAQEIAPILRPLSPVALAKFVEPESSPDWEAEGDLVEKHPIGIPRSDVEQKETPMDAEQEKRLERMLGRMEKVLHDATADKQPGAPVATMPHPTGIAGDDEELLFRRFRDRLLRDPVVLKVLRTEKSIEVEVKREVLSVDGATMLGRVALMVKDGFMDDGEGKSGNQVWLEMRRRGYPSKSNAAPTALYEVLSGLADDGFLTYDLTSKRYQAVDGVGRRIKEAG